MSNQGWAAAAGAATSAVGGIVGQAMANSANRKESYKQRTHNTDMWERQVDFDSQMWHKQNEFDIRMRDEQRDYELGLWHMQNKYNSPIEQMARLKEAGLNPHLMYDKGTVGEAGMAGAAKQPQASQLTAASPMGYSRAEMRNVLQGIDVFGDFVRFKNLQAQTDNVQANTAVAQQEAMNKAQARVLQVLDINRKSIDNRMARELYQTSVDGARVNLQSMQKDLERKTHETDILVKTKDAAIQSEVGKLRGILLNNDGKKLDNALKAWEVSLNKHGITKTDGKMWRIAAKTMEGMKGLDWQKQKIFYENLLKKLWRGDYNIEKNNY